MRKLIKILLIFTVVFTITACNKNDTSDTVKNIDIEWNSDNNLADVIRFKIEAIDTTKQITPDVIGDSYTYFGPADENNYLVDLILWMTNTTDQDIHLNSSFSGLFITEDTNYKAAVLSLNDDGTILSDSDLLSAGSTKKIHYYAEMPEKSLQKEIEFELSNQKQDSDKQEISTVCASLKFEVNKTNNNYETKNMGEVINLDGYADVTLTGANIIKELRPASPAGLYNTYTVQQESNSLVDFSVVINNISGNDINAGNVITARLLDVNSNSYPATVVYEDDNHSNLQNATSITIKNNQSAIIHYLFEVSDEVVNESKKIRISWQGNVYLINL